LFRRHDDKLTREEGMTMIESQGTAVSAGDVKVGDVYACVESERRYFPRRQLTVKAIKCGGTKPTAVCDATRDGAALKVEIALYRLINPTKFRLIESPAVHIGEVQAGC
jgi:hypothetical protein